MSSKNPYAGTILENTYSPVVFQPAKDVPALQIDAEEKKSSISAFKIATVAAVAGATLPVSLPVSLVAGLATGLAVSFTPEKRKKGDPTFGAAELLDEIAPIVLPPFDILEGIFKRKELSMISKKYEEFAKQANEDLELYMKDHEAYLQTSMDAVDGINRRKVLMKDYLLLELSEQLKRSGLNGSFSEPVIERFDPRDWPINRKYSITVDRIRDFIEITQSYGPVFKIRKFMLSPVSNRIRIKQIRNALDQLKPIAEMNLEQMISDLVKLDLFSAALVNIDTIYKEVLDRLRPIMKKILKDLEDKFRGDVKQMPKVQADALYTIKSLFKDLAEITIVPRSVNNNSIYSDVCEYSNTLSERYNAIRETIYQNFCN